MQAIAAENNLSETSFLVPEGEGFALRWFTPTQEVELCGHATLAAAHVLFRGDCAQQEELCFQTRSGALWVRRSGEGYSMDFPALPVEPCEIPDALREGLGAEPLFCAQGMDYLVLLESELQLAGLRPDFRRMLDLELRGLIVTAPGEELDFVSRFFAPKYGIDEDPVTGSAHCALTPFWAKRLGKTELEALQISKRRGRLRCRLQGERVFLSGSAVSVIEGAFYIPD